MTGNVVAGFVAPPRPEGLVIETPQVRLEPLRAQHAAVIHAAVRDAPQVWDFMGYGPFADEAAYRHWIAQGEGGTDPAFYAFVDPATGQARGVAAFLRITPEHGVIEIGHILLTPPLQRTVAASAALMAMIGWAFEAGYRRVEWKCDARNTRSRRAALRLGFRFEGVFRAHMIVKGRRRDTAWYALTLDDWPAVQAAHQAWLAPGNFDAQGRQQVALSRLTEDLRGERPERASGGDI